MGGAESHGGPGIIRDSMEAAGTAGEAQSPLSPGDAGTDGERGCRRSRPAPLSLWLEKGISVWFPANVFI